MGNTADTKLCNSCGVHKPTHQFGKNHKGKLRGYCKVCFNKQAHACEKKRWGTPEGAELKRAKDKRSQDRRKQLRRSEDSLQIAKIIVEDSRKTDKKLNRINDLDTSWVMLEIAKPCQYCGENSLRMTLDRIDNSLGHVKNNVTPACIRCNYARRDMPHTAWIKLAPAMREARLAGDFGVWTGRCR